MTRFSSSTNFMTGFMPKRSVPARIASTGNCKPVFMLFLNMLFSKSKEYRRLRRRLGLNGLSGARRLAVAGHRDFGGPAHQRGRVLAEQHFAVTDLSAVLQFAYGPRVMGPAATRLPQRLR